MRNKLISLLVMGVSLATQAQAFGLGDLLRQPVLGERLWVEIPLRGSGKDVLDPACYRLRPPLAAEEIPWLKDAQITVRTSQPPILEIRSRQIVNDPILMLAVHMACGRDVVREYTLLAMPPKDAQSAVVRPVAELLKQDAKASSGSSSVLSDTQDLAPVAPKPVRKRAAPPRQPLQVTPAALQPAFALSSDAAQTPVQDRLLLSGGGEVGEPVLRMALALDRPLNVRAEMPEAQREILRLEFRMLQALQAQALSQLEAKEKLKDLDRAVHDHQKATSEQAAPALHVPPSLPVAVPSVVMPQGASAPAEADDFYLYAGLLLAFLCALGGIAWRNFQARKQQQQVDAYLAEENEAHYSSIAGQHFVSEAVDVPAPRVVEDPAPVPEAVSALPDMPQIDALPDVPSVIVDFDTPPDMIQAAVLDIPVVQAAVDPAPVMELADIMLSFGRVKGAAQALQEFVDANPKEAIQPWMRLLDVYRGADMREEFDDLARKLNKNFNVAVPAWEPAVAPLSGNTIDFVLEETQVSQVIDRSGLEDMPRITQQIIERWSDAAATSEFILQLLRDNRGGERLGFPLGVVEDMLFLLDLQKNIAQEAAA